jgi:hypothetical protein
MSRTCFVNLPIPTVDVKLVPQTTNEVVCFISLTTKLGELLKLLVLNSFIVINEDFLNKAPELILNE